MNLQQRIAILSKLGDYILENGEPWQTAKEKASQYNPWFASEFIEQACQQIAQQFLEPSLLEDWVGAYHLPAENSSPKKIGLVMAGNIPLVGFHDWLCVFITGHIACIKPSSKDDVLLRHLVDYLQQENPEINQLVHWGESIPHCDAYIATGSNNSAGYFEYYFKKYPSIIRRNRTAVAVLTGEESSVDLGHLADDVHTYFGLGCRNVTKLYVPKDYDFQPLLAALHKYDYLLDNHKYKNNYDYNLALLLLNKTPYLTNGSVLLAESTAFFSPISQLNYEHYVDEKELKSNLSNQPELQCVVGGSSVGFGQAQYPGLGDYADGVDTLAFLLAL